MIRITGRIALDEAALSQTFVRASGPGGQNVNKVSTAVELRLDLTRANLPADLVARLRRVAGKRLTLSNEIVITSQRHRTQERNRAEALAVLVDLLQRAAIAPKPRFGTKPTAASRERRLDSKAHRARTKQRRSVPTD